MSSLCGAGIAAEVGLLRGHERRHGLRSPLLRRAARRRCSAPNGPTPGPPRSWYLATFPSTDMLNKPRPAVPKPMEGGCVHGSGRVRDLRPGAEPGDRAASHVDAPAETAASQEVTSRSRCRSSGPTSTRLHGADHCHKSARRPVESAWRNARFGCGPRLVQKRTTVIT